MSLPNAAATCRASALRGKLDAGAQIEERDAKGRTALFRAARVGRLENILLLLERGAAPNAKDDTDEAPLQAAATANQCLVPQGIPKSHWDRLSGAERFYLKLIDLEGKGLKTLDNYQNFAKAFKVRDFKALMGSQTANSARLKSAVEFGRLEMSEGSELHQSVLRAVLYALMELIRNVDGNEVLAHLMLNVPDYYGNATHRELVAELSDYLASKLEAQRPEEASAARVLRELMKSQRLG
jgi:putative DNA methylase